MIGYPPFFSEDPATTCEKIRNWRQTLVFPPEPVVSAEAKDLMLRLMCDASHRLNFAQIQRHPFFKGIDWDNMHKTKAPIIPKVSHETDVQNFDKFDAVDETAEEEEEDGGSFSSGGGSSSSRMMYGDGVDRSKSPGAGKGGGGGGGGGGGAGRGGGGGAGAAAGGAGNGGDGAKKQQGRGDDEDDEDGIGAMPSSAQRNNKTRKGGGGKRESIPLPPESNPFFGYTYKGDKKQAGLSASMFEAPPSSSAANSTSPVRR